MAKSGGRSLMWMSPGGRDLSLLGPAAAVGRVGRYTGSPGCWGM